MTAVTMQLGQKQRDCQVASQLESRKSSRELDKVACRCSEDMQKPRVRGADQYNIICRKSAVSTSNSGYGSPLNDRPMGA